MKNNLAQEKYNKVNAEYYFLNRSLMSHIILKLNIWIYLDGAIKYSLSLPQNKFSSMGLLNENIILLEKILILIIFKGE